MVTPVNKAAVLYGNFDLRIEDRPMPVPGPREVLVEVASVGVCGSDVHYYEHGRIGDFVVRAPLVLGHETSGIVVGRGGSARRHELGQRVALEPGVPCGSCRECRTGHYNLCRDVVFFATPPVDGTLARYVTIHEDYAFALPDHVSDDAGALCEPLSVGLWACRKAGITVGARRRGRRWRADRCRGHARRSRGRGDRGHRQRPGAGTSGTPARSRGHLRRGCDLVGTREGGGGRGRVRRLLRRRRRRFSTASGPCARRAPPCSSGCVPLQRWRSLSPTCRPGRSLLPVRFATPTPIRRRSPSWLRGRSISKA